MQNFFKQKMIATCKPVDRPEKLNKVSLTVLLLNSNATYSSNQIYQEKNIINRLKSDLLPKYPLSNLLYYRQIREFINLLQDKPPFYR